MNESLNDPELAPTQAKGLHPGDSQPPALPAVDVSYNVELVRKAIHLFSLSIPLIYYFIPRDTALLILVPLTAAFVVVDVARYYHRPTADWFYAMFGWLLRSREQNEHRKRLNGASYVLLSATLCVAIFPKLITITAFSILIVSDSLAALVGRKFGRRPFFRKTAEGSLAFFLSAVVVVLCTPKVEYAMGEFLIGIAAAAVGAFVEAMSIELDDNLSIPLSIGATMWLLYFLTYPAFEISRLAISF